MQKLQSLNIKEIFELLPHRYPFLLVDKVSQYGLKEGNEYAIGVKNVTINEHFFQGHFPNEPVFPGVFIIEALAQISGIAILANKTFDNKDYKNLKKTPYIVKIEDAVFYAKVVPGDVLYLNSIKIRKMLEMYVFEAQAVVDGKVVAQAKITALFK